MDSRRLAWQHMGAYKGGGGHETAPSPEIKLANLEVGTNICFSRSVVKTMFRSVLACFVNNCYSLN